MAIVFAAILMVAGFMFGRMSEMDWYLIHDAMVHWRTIITNTIPGLMFFALGALTLGIGRIAAFIHYKEDVRKHMPEIIRVQLGDAEAKAKRWERDADYWKARAEEQNALVRNMDRQIDRLKSIASAFETENEIQRQRKKAT